MSKKTAMGVFQLQVYKLHRTQVDGNSISDGIKTKMCDWLRNNFFQAFNTELEDPRSFVGVFSLTMKDLWQDIADSVPPDLAASLTALRLRKDKKWQHKQSSSHNREIDALRFVQLTVELYKYLNCEVDLDKIQDLTRRTVEKYREFEEELIGIETRVPFTEDGDLRAGSPMSLDTDSGLSETASTADSNEYSDHFPELPTHEGLSPLAGTDKTVEPGSPTDDIWSKVQGFVWGQGRNAEEEAERGIEKKEVPPLVQSASGDLQTSRLKGWLMPQPQTPPTTCLQKMLNIVNEYYSPVLISDENALQWDPLHNVYSPLHKLDTLPNQSSSPLQQDPLNDWKCPGRRPSQSKENSRIQERGNLLGPIGSCLNVAEAESLKSATSSRGRDGLHEVISLSSRDSPVTSDATSRSEGAVIPEGGCDLFEYADFQFVTGYQCPDLENWSEALREGSYEVLCLEMCKGNWGDPICPYHATSEDLEETERLLKIDEQGSAAPEENVDKRINCKELQSGPNLLEESVEFAQKTSWTNKPAACLEEFCWHERITLRESTPTRPRWCRNLQAYRKDPFAQSLLLDVYKDYYQSDPSYFGNMICLGLHLQGYSEEGQEYSEEQLLNFCDMPAMPRDKALTCEEFERIFARNSLCGPLANSRRRRPLHPNKPCSFYLEGCCSRSDCKFSHDLSSITCHFWKDGQCFKGDMCPFLHGYNTGDNRKTSKAKKYLSSMLHQVPGLSSRSSPRPSRFRSRSTRMPTTKSSRLHESFTMRREEFPELRRKESSSTGVQALKKKKINKKLASLRKNVNTSISWEN